MLNNQILEPLLSSEEFICFIQKQPPHLQKSFLYQLPSFNQEAYIFYFELLNDAIKDDYLAYHYLGVCYENICDFKNAIKAYNISHMLNPAKIKSRIYKDLLELENISNEELALLKNTLKTNSRFYRPQILHLAPFLIKKEDPFALELLNAANTDCLLTCYLKSLVSSCIKPELFKLKIPKTQSDTLSIVIQAGSIEGFNTYDFDGDRLDVLDLSNTYYVLTYEDILRELKEFLKTHKYKKVSIFGNSKSGLFSMFAFSKLQENFPDINFTGAIISGFVTLLPLHKDILRYIESAKILQFLSILPDVKNAIITMQEVAYALQISEKNSFYFIYGDKSPADKFQGEFLKYAPTNINICELDYSGHGVVLPLTLPEGKSRAWLEEKYNSMSVENDLRGADGDLMRFIDEIENIYKSGLRLRDFLY